MKKFFWKLMICVAVIGCLEMNADTVYACEDVVLEKIELMETISRAKGAFNVKIAGNTTVTAGGIVYP